MKTKTEILEKLKNHPQFLILKSLKKKELLQLLEQIKFDQIPLLQPNDSNCTDSNIINSILNPS